VSACLICLRPLDAGSRYHPSCARRLFGRGSVSATFDIDVRLAEMQTLGLAMVGRTSISGVQRKISVNVSADRKTLQVAAGPGRYLLKPQSQIYAELPQNELLTMRLAETVGIEIPPCGLVSLADGSLGYLVRRFDRPDGGGKLRQEDFCQLAGKFAREKYTGSAEMCARLLRRHASEPLIELLKLFRRTVFSWWTGNGDMHLKNFSLLADADSVYRLSPAYDLLCTRLAIPDDQLALPVDGKRDGLARTDWLRYADYCGIRRPAAERVLRTLARSLDEALALVSRAPLSADARTAYSHLLRDRTVTLE
jgi:serine/threonine-protein kinase HipA